MDNKLYENRLNYYQGLEELSKLTEEEKENLEYSKSAYDFYYDVYQEKVKTGIVSNSSIDAFAEYMEIKSDEERSSDPDILFLQECTASSLWDLCCYYQIEQFESAIKNPLERCKKFIAEDRKDENWSASMYRDYLQLKDELIKHEGDVDFDILQDCLCSIEEENTNKYKDTDRFAESLSSLPTSMYSLLDLAKYTNSVKTDKSGLEYYASIGHMEFNIYKMGFLIDYMSINEYHRLGQSDTKLHPKEEKCLNSIIENANLNFINDLILNPNFEFITDIIPKEIFKCLLDNSSNDADDCNDNVETTYEALPPITKAFVEVLENLINDELHSDSMSAENHNKPNDSENFNDTSASTAKKACISEAEGELYDSLKTKYGCCQCVKIENGISYAFLNDTKYYVLPVGKSKLLFHFLVDPDNVYPEHVYAHEEQPKDIKRLTDQWESLIKSPIGTALDGETDPLNPHTHLGAFGHISEATVWDLYMCLCKKQWLYCNQEEYNLFVELLAGRKTKHETWRLIWRSDDKNLTVFMALLCKGLSLYCARAKYWFVLEGGRQFGGDPSRYRKQSYLDNDIANILHVNPNWPK